MLLVLLVPVVALLGAPLPLLLLPLEVRPGHPSATHGQGASRCGHFRAQEAPRPPYQPAVMITGAAPLFASSWTQPAQPSQPRTWPKGWDQAALVQSFSTMGLTLPVSTEWITDSGASFHTTPDASILSSVRPPHPSCPSSIIVDDGSCLPVTAVGSAPGFFSSSQCPCCSSDGS